MRLCIGRAGAGMGERISFISQLSFLISFCTCNALLDIAMILFCFGLIFFNILIIILMCVLYTSAVYNHNKGNVKVTHQLPA